MRIGGSIVLGVIGAILYFAVDVEVSGLDLATVGIILLIAAAVWFVIELIRGVSGASTTTTETTRTSDGTVEQRETQTKNRTPDA